MAIADWSTTPANNDTTLGVNIAEGCPAANVNNALRKLMADVATGINFSLLGSFLASTTLSQAQSALGVGAGSTSATAFDALTNEANKVPYMTGSNAWAKADLTSFGRQVIATGDATALNALLGGGSALSVTASSLTNPGYVKFSISGANFIIQWGSQSFSNGSNSVTYPTAYSTFSIAVMSGYGADNLATSATSTTGFTVTSGNSGSVTGWWISVGK